MFKVCDKIWQVGRLSLVEASNCSHVGMKGADGKAQDLRRPAKRTGGGAAHCFNATDSLE